MGVLPPPNLWPWPSGRQDMPLLRSLADGATRVAINMALLTELFTSPLPCCQGAIGATFLSASGSGAGADKNVRAPFKGMFIPQSQRNPRSRPRARRLRFRCRARCSGRPRLRSGAGRRPPGGRAIPTTGRTSDSPPVDPQNGAVPKLNTPPSAATNQYPAAPLDAIDTMGRLSGRAPIDP